MNLFFPPTIPVNPRGQLLPNLCHNLCPCLPRDTVDPTVLSAAVFCNEIDSQAGSPTDRWTGRCVSAVSTLAESLPEGPASDYRHTVGVSMCCSRIPGWQSAA